MVEMFPLRSEDAAYNKIKVMLSTLGDPFTRIISPKVLFKSLSFFYHFILRPIHVQEYQSFRIGSDGNLQGVGLFINAEPKTGHLVGLCFMLKMPPIIRLLQIVTQTYICCPYLRLFSHA